MANRYRTGLIALGLLGTLIVAEGRTNASEPVAATPAAAAFQPLEMLPSGHPVVRVAVDGSAPRRFVIDTAASETTILPKLRAAMAGLVVKPSDEPLDGAAGRSEVETATVGLLEVAGFGFRSLEALVLPPGPVDGLGVDGILGADIIADFAVELDIPAHRWRMTRSADAAMLRGLSASVPFTLDEERAPRLTIRLNGVEVPAVLDTGARGTIINWAAAKAIGLTPDTPGLVKGTDVRGATAHATPSVKAKLARLSIDTAEMRDRDIRIADLPVFKVLGFEADQPAVILGIDMFADRRFVIDHPGLRLHVSPPADPASGPKQP